MELSKFIEKFNKIEGNSYTFEEEVTLTNGVYVGYLEHDNVVKESIAIYTGSGLTGTKIKNYFLSSPSLAPWKYQIKVYATDIEKLYISYETTGDQVEAEDINNLQNAVNETQEELNKEISRATNRENTIEKNLNNEITRAKATEKTLTDNLSKEIDRATNAEKLLTDNLASEVQRAKGSEKVLTDNLNSEITRAKNSEKTITDNFNTYKVSNDSEIQNLKNKDADLENKKANLDYVNTELKKRYLKTEVFTKEEVLAKIEELIGTAPEILDTFGEIATALGNDPNFATTITTLLSKKVDKIDGKGLSTNDYTNAEKSNLADCNNKKHTHVNKSIIDKITQALLDNWSAAYTHISDTIKHITATERTNWNDANSKKHEHSNKSVLDTITSALISNWSSAYTHITDTIKHITSAERTLWNTVSNKLDATANAVSASKLQTARTINGVSFDGSKNITIADNTKMPITRITTAKDFNTLTSTGIYIIKVNNCTNTPTGNWGTLYVSNEGTLFQLYIPDNSYAEYKRVYNSNTSQWSSWTNLISKSAVGLGNVDNTSDLNKPISNATKDALNGKANASHTHTKSQITDMPTKLSQFSNDAGFITQSDIDTSQNHTHSNKSILDKVTQALLDTWNGKADGDHTHNVLISKGRKTASDLPSTWNTGLYMTEVYNNGYPCSYGNCLTLKSSNNAITQICMEWKGSDKTIGSMWIRNKRDNGTDAWSEWREFSFSNHAHDDRYYTETEIDNKLKTKVNKGCTWNELEGV